MARRLYKMDLNNPLTFKNSQFDAVYCVAVLVHIKEAENLLHEFCRLVRNHGYIVFSQRNDLIDKYNYDNVFKKMTDEHLWRCVFSSEDMPFIPGHAYYSDRIKARYFVYQVQKEI